IDTARAPETPEQRFAMIATETWIGFCRHVSGDPMRAHRVLPALLAASALAAPAAGQVQPAFAQPNRVAPTDAVSMKSSFAPVVRRAAPAVVNISAKRLVRQQVDPAFWAMFGRGIPQERIAQSLGSGVIVRADGVIVTNNHVI